MSKDKKEKVVIKPLNNYEISTFSSQMSMMLSAGISVKEALHLIEQDADTAEAQELTTRIHASLEKCGGFPRIHAGNGPSGRENR